MQTVSNAPNDTNVSGAPCKSKGSPEIDAQNVISGGNSDNADGSPEIDAQMGANSGEIRIIPILYLCHRHFRGMSLHRQTARGIAPGTGVDPETGLNRTPG